MIWIQTVLHSVSVRERIKKKLGEDNKLFLAYSGLSDGPAQLISGSM